MKQLIFLLLISSGSYGQSIIRTTVVVPTIEKMKTEYGSANHAHVVANNTDYNLCSPCTADEVTVFAGAIGRKWKKQVTSGIPLDSIASIATKANQAALVDSADDLRTTMNTPTNLGFGISFEDDLLAIDSADAGFKAFISSLAVGGSGNNASSLTTGTLPDGRLSSNVVTLTGSQTLTNKTITNPTGIVKADVGLGNVDNTSDANKPVSTPQQAALDVITGGTLAALDLKANISSPVFTGLSGFGVTATSTIHSSGSVAAAIASISANTTLDATHYTLVCTTTSAFTITLPAASTCSGRIYNIKKVSNDNNNLTIDANGSETIDGDLTQIIVSAYSSLTIQSTGAAWVIL